MWSPTCEALPLRAGGSPFLNDLEKARKIFGLADEKEKKSGHKEKDFIFQQYA